MLCCVVWPPQTNEKWERTKLKVKAYVLEEIIMVNRRRPVKKLTNLLFCVSPRQDWDNSGLPAHDMQRGRCQWYETLIVAKQIGWKKVWAVWIAKEWWQEKMMHQKIHTHFFVERTLANSMERKWREKIIVSCCRWFLMLPGGGIEGRITAFIKTGNWALGRHRAIWNGQGEETDEWAGFFKIMKVGKVKKAHKNEPALNCLCLLKKGPLTMRSLCGGALAAGGAMAALAGRVPILLREHFESVHLRQGYY